MIEKKGVSVITSLLGFSVISIITAVIGFVIVPMSTRLIDAADLGKINMLQSVVNVLMPCLCLGFDHGYIRKYCEMERIHSKRLFSSSLFISISITLTAFAFISISWRKASYLMVGEERYDVLVIMMISTISYIVERYLQVQHRLDNNIGKYAAVTLVFMSANKIIYVLAAFFQPAYVDLLYVMAISELFAVLVMLVVDKNEITPRPCKYFELADSFKFGFPLMLSYVIYQLTQYIPKHYLRLNFGFSNVGIFSTAVTIAGIITLLQSGFTLVWTPYVYANYKEKGKEIDRLQELLVVALTIATTLVIVFQYFLVYIVGDKYREMTNYLPILLMVPVFNSLGEITGIGINIAKKTKLHLINNVSAVVITFVFARIFIPYFGSTGAALAAAGGSATLFLMRTFEGVRLYMPVKNFKLMAFGIVALIALGAINYAFSNRTIILYALFCIIVIAEAFVLQRQIRTAAKQVLTIMRRKGGIR